jgi:hypothetical protein
METVDMRKALHQYIDERDDKLIKMMYAMANAYNEEDDYEFTEEEIKEFDEIREKRLKGESKLYSWEEEKAIILQKQPVK